MRIKLITLAVGITILAAFALSVNADHPGRGRGPRVVVAVQATDTSGATLHYRWKSTDGSIDNVDSASTNWTLPAGPGLHFAYVLVSNGLGGYTERRIAVNTDTIGSRTDEDEPEGFHRPIAPPAPAQVGDYYRSFLPWSQTTVPVNHDVYMPDLVAFLQDTATNARYPSTGTVTSDEKGQVLVPGVPPGNNYVMNCSVDGGATFTDCTGGAQNPAVMLPAATSDYIDGGPLNAPDPIVGSVALADGSPCGTFNEFFGVHVTATATLLDAGNNILAGPQRVNEFGDYALLANPNAAMVSLKCEGAVPLLLAVSGPDLGRATFAGVNPPVVAGMTATLHGHGLAPPVAIFLPPPTNFPSDIMPRSDGFLAGKGLDTPLGACQYYKAVGAVRGCDSAGNMIGAITFQDWRHAVKIGKFAVGGVPTFTAAYINKVDLNLARVQESITYGPNTTAGVVCNHLGPPGNTPDQLVNPSQADIDTAVDNAVNDQNLVACVAMDYTVSSGVNNSQPFVRFLIFGPSGELLPSVNLDGRREKFVPGTCVVCHGGDHYAGKFPEDGSGFANIGGHFLPYDVGNFEFSSKPGLTKADQQLALYNLNQNVRNAGPTLAEQDLITGWYQTSPPNAPVLDENFTPPSWQAIGDPNAIDFYRKVVARSCRTCHVALVEGFNFDHYQNIAPNTTTDRFFDPALDLGINVCGGSGQFVRDHMMPNSLITFNRLWLSSGTSADQPALLNQFYGNVWDCPAPAGQLP